MKKLSKNKFLCCRRTFQCIRTMIHLYYVEWHEYRSKQTEKSLLGSRFFDFSLIFIVITIFFAVMKHTRIWLKKYILCYVCEHIAATKIIAWVRIRKVNFFVVDGDITEVKSDNKCTILRLHVINLNATTTLPFNDRVVVKFSSNTLRSFIVIFWGLF